MTTTPDQIETEAVERFKAAWEAADAEGDHGNRVRRGLRAAGLLMRGKLTDDPITDNQHELVLNALDRLANQAILSAGGTVLVPKNSGSVQAMQDSAAGDAELVRAALAAARVAPVQCGEPHPFMEGVCILPAGHEPGHECAPVTPSPDRELGALRRVWKALGCELNPDDYKPSVRDLIWKQIVELCAESAAGITRVHRENEELRELLADRPAPSPDREKLIEKLRDGARGEVDGTTIPVPVEDCRAIAAALAVPPVVNEAPTPVTIAHAKRGGKTSALVDAVLAKANERGIAVTMVPPVVNEAKLAEIIHEHVYMYTTRSCACGWGAPGTHIEHQVAEAVERQREWLGDAR